MFRWRRGWCCLRRGGSGRQKGRADYVVMAGSTKDNAEAQRTLRRAEKNREMLGFSFGGVRRAIVDIAVFVRKKWRVASDEWRVKNGCGATSVIGIPRTGELSPG